MLFNSISFLIFFPIVTILYYLASFRWKWLVLLIASCIFYLVFIPVYIFILFYLIIVDYTAGIFLSKLKGKKRKFLLLISILSNIGILFFFKYSNFFQINVQQLASLIHWNYSPQLLNLILPIGLSFHTFQSLGYVIDVYKRKQKPEKHLGKYALFVMFYPQLVAGPIERAAHLIPQFYVNHKFDENNVSEGLRRMLLGFFKKLVIADRLAIMVNQVYGSPHSYIGFPLILATVAFAFQVYCDFSGYSDIAIGAARVMGFNLPENFNAPYLATSIRDFWRRWHITLYSWFRDYIYIPLGGSRKGELINIRNILIVFFVTGLWHGANWTYVVWGLIHGFYMVINLLVSQYKLPLKVVISSKLLLFFINLFKIGVTFVLVCIAWIFFRAATISDGLYILSHATTGLLGLFNLALQKNTYDLFYMLFDQHHGVGLTLPQIGIVFGAVVLMEILQLLERRKLYPSFPFPVRLGIYLILALAIVNFSPVNPVPFIYFKF
ncbi:MAG TPA: MBOAT family O-acyltransferase [Patescibacteria group bacterium]|jgi:D-alanyl-lipoteichoic acid acyltransferase DltB (MBOAT superfamily)|nr:MBOAT family O-acyltransferase [Patescibacteria group bacterium]